MFAVASIDGTASIWDVESLKRVGNPFPPHPGAVPDVLFEPSGRLLVPISRTPKSGLPTFQRGSSSPAVSRDAT